eukprot:g11061.t1
MDDSLKDMDDMCIQINKLGQELGRRRVLSEEGISQAVDLVQKIGSCVACSYSSQRGARGEEFAQPFIDRRVSERFRELLLTGNVRLQIFSAAEESILFCNLTAGWYLNHVVTADYDFSKNEDLLHLWMTVVKDIALMMDGENMMLFFDPTSNWPFPIFSQSARFYHHPVAQVRTQVQATSLEIFTKLMPGLKDG